MFDANARYLPNSQVFFVECHSVSNKYAPLEAGSIYLCQKVSGDEKTCSFKVFLSKSKEESVLIEVDLHNEETYCYETLLVYSGNPDGSDFISEEWKEKAMNFLK